jgi:D-alanine-D-alanine ligase
MKKIVAILFGGKSAEHEVSLQSAKNIVGAIDKEKYNVVLIGIDKQGKWLLNNNSHSFLNPRSPKSIKLSKSGDSIALVPHGKGEIVNFSNPKNKLTVDIAFPVLHGPFGEDGTIQGLLKLAGVPFVGAGVLGSAVGMDKDIMKRLLRDAKIPIAKFLVFKDTNIIKFEKVVENIGLPFFVKPANLGSSVGISKVKSKKDFRKAITEAFRYDRKILLEEYINGREIECSILGNDSPIASVPGEVITNNEFYSYKAKYIDENGAVLEIPAKLEKNVIKKIQNLAIKTFETLSCEGLGRVDFFLQNNGEVIVNEINTIPGFTSISMYPKLWEASGMSYTNLIDKLILLAIERFEKEQKLSTMQKIWLPNNLI